MEWIEDYVGNMCILLSLLCCAGRSVVLQDWLPIYIYIYIYIYMGEGFLRWGISTVGGAR
jgi:hypothetical protein